MPQGIRYVVYARKSTESDDRQALSIPAQLRELREMAARHGLKIVEELTESFSAREPGRPVFSKLLSDIAAGKVEAILCWKLDRLARNPVDGAMLTHHLGKGRLKEIRTVEGRHDGTGDSKFMLSVHFGAATKMIDDLSANVKRGNRELHERGRITGVPPLGYMKVRDPRQIKGAGRVVPDPQRFPLVEGIWLDVASRRMLVADAWRRAVGLGLHTPATRRRSGGPIKLGAIYKILRNRFYAGDVVRLGEVFKGEHRAMVTRERFDRVQEIIEGSPHEVPRPSRNEFLYRGLLHCGHCGRVLTGERHPKGGREYVYYRCARRRPGYPICHAPAPSEGQVTEDILASLERLRLGPNLSDWVRRAVDWWERTSREADITARANLQSQLSEIEGQRKRASLLLVQGKLDERVHAELDRDLAAEEARVRELRDVAGEVDREVQASVESALSLGNDVSELFRCATADERRRLMAEVYENFAYLERKAVVELRFPYSVLGDARDLALGRDGGDANPSDGRSQGSTTRKKRARDMLAGAPFSVGRPPAPL